MYITIQWKINTNRARLPESNNVRKALCLHTSRSIYMCGMCQKITASRFDDQFMSKGEIETFMSAFMKVYFVKEFSGTR